MTFKELFLESFDTSFQIIKKERINGVDRFYLEHFNNKVYRIYFEKVDDIISIGFERFVDKWFISGLTNDLTSKEVLQLFGTTKVLLKTQSFKGIFITTQEVNKSNLYFNMINKLNKDYKWSVSRDDDSIYMIDPSLEFDEKETKKGTKYYFKKG